MADLRSPVLSVQDHMLLRHKTICLRLRTCVFSECIYNARTLGGTCRHSDERVSAQAHIRCPSCIHKLGDTEAWCMYIDIKVKHVYVYDMY